MKKKTIILAAGIAALALALLFAGLPLFSRLYYGRSQAATLFAWQLKKDAYTTQEAFAEYLEEKRIENGEPYLMPDPAALSVSFVPRWSGSMQYYVLNRSAGADRLLVYFPGGSYIDQPRPVHWQFLDDIAQRTSVMIAVPIYPKLPDADADAAYAALTEFYTEVVAGKDYGEVIFMGDSAGGGMALSLAMQLRDRGLGGPDKLILLCPWVDVTMTNPDIPAYEKKDPALDSEQLRRLGELWAGGLDPADPAVSPLYGTYEDLGGITLITGTGELLYPDIMLLDRALTDGGIDHHTIVKSGMFHVWPLYHAYNVPEAQETFEDIVRAIDPSAESAIPLGTG